MRATLLLLCCSALAAGDLAQLQQLTHDRRFFDLRRTLRQPGWNNADTLFYRGLVASRFGHETEGIQLLREFLEAKPDADSAQRALQEITAALMRLGRYREASQVCNEALTSPSKNPSDREDDENTRALLDAIGEAAPETVEFTAAAPIKAAHNHLASWNVPVQVNGVAGDWVFDTGASITTVSESEAKRMGLTVRDSKAHAISASDKRIAVRVAVADLQFGPAHVRNAILLVLSDQALYIAPVHEQMTGALGLPVLRALGRVGISRDGAVEIGPAKSMPAGDPNLFFDNGLAMVEISRGEPALPMTQALQMTLDTGYASTVLNPSFHRALTDQETANLKIQKGGFGSAGGSVERDMAVIPELQIRVLTKTVDMKNPILLSDTPKGDARYRDGVIGIDALWSGFLLDFESMRLTIN